jgi:hypothetical protein
MEVVMEEHNREVIPGYSVGKYAFHFARCDGNLGVFTT